MIDFIFALLPTNVEIPTPDHPISISSEMADRAIRKVCQRIDEGTSGKDAMQIPIDMAEILAAGDAQIRLFNLQRLKDRLESGCPQNGK